jgi:hypothetical protein
VVDAVWLANADIVGVPVQPLQVKVAPFTVIANPLAQFVPTPIWEVPVPVADDVRVPNATVDPVAPAQLEFVMPEVPVQKTSVSSTDAVKLICAAVLAATAPVSVAPVE